MDSFLNGGSIVDSPEYKVPGFTWYPAGTRSFDTSPHSVAVRFVQHAFASLDGVRDALPNAAIVAASCASAGSVRGYDDLFPANPSVVSERRHPGIRGVVWVSSPTAALKRATRTWGIIQRLALVFLQPTLRL